MLLDGVHVPLTTPFYRDGASYWRKLEHNVRRYSLGPIAGLVALPPGSEAATLTTGEQKQTLSVVQESAAAEKVLLAGVECGSVYTALELAEHAYTAEFDAVLLAAPLQWSQLHDPQLPTGELALFFQTVADRSPLPVVLWSPLAVRDPVGVGNQAQRSGGQLSLELIASLATHPNVLGLYHADLSAEQLGRIRERTAGVRREVTVTPVFAPVTRRMLHLKPAGTGSFVSASALSASTKGSVTMAMAPPQPALRTRSKTVGFQVMAAGHAIGLAELLHQGVNGVMPTLTACAPQATHEVFAAFKDGNAALAAEKELRLHAADRLLAEFGPAGLKYACDLNGFYGGLPRLPKIALNATDRDQVDMAMRALRQ